MSRDHSERFIHHELLRRSEAAINHARITWQRDRKVYPTLLLWPQDHVRTTTGSHFTGVIFTALPADEEERQKAVVKAASACKAYALLVIEQKPDQIRAVFESAHGTRAWKIPIIDHGTVQTLGQAEFKDNAESLGILWHDN